MKFEHAETSTNNTNQDGDKSVELDPSLLTPVVGAEQTVVVPMPSGMTVRVCIEIVEGNNLVILEAIREDYKIDLIDEAGICKGACEASGMNVLYVIQFGENHPGKVHEVGKEPSITYNYKTPDDTEFKVVVSQTGDTINDVITYIEMTSDLNDAKQTIRVLNPNTDYTRYSNNVDTPVSLIAQENNGNGLNTTAIYKAESEHGNIVSKADYFLNDKLAASGYAEYTYINPENKDSAKTLMCLSIERENNSPVTNRIIVNSFNGSVIKDPISDVINTMFDADGHYLVDAGHYPYFNVGAMFQVYCSALDKKAKTA